MRIIMVPVADRPECALAMDAAFDMAAELQANIYACHIRPHRYSAINLPDAAISALPSGEMPELNAAEKKAAAEASHSARALVQKLAESRKFSMVRRLRGSSQRCLVWNEDVGHVEKLMPIIGPFADLIVVSRPRKKSSRIARLFMLEALLNSSRPVLILPPNRKVRMGKRIVIGWDQTHNAMQAVIAALPLLARAEHVSIITSGKAKPNGPKARQLVNYLRAWDIAATARQTRGSHTDATTDITGHYEESAADLLVIGSYSQSRFRQRIFGGVTEHFLTKTIIPVFTVHA